LYIRVLGKSGATPLLAPGGTSGKIFLGCRVGQLLYPNFLFCCKQHKRIVQQDCCFDDRYEV
jgi:hypothetical protein